jgi:hypothetical protein
MRIVITGGAGLIGKALCTTLIDEGHEVIVLSRNPDRTKKMPISVRLYPWDGATVGDWAQLVDGSDAIINLAGEGIADGRWSPMRKQRILESRVQAGRAVTQAIQQANKRPKVLIQASAVGYYGPHKNELIDESASPGSDFLSRVCFEWEGASAAVESLGVRRPILRTGIVLSKDGGALPRMLLPFHFFAGGPIGSGKQWYPWIHIADEVAAIRFLLQHERASGPFNLSAPLPLTNKELAGVIGKVMGRPALFPTPGFAMQLVFGEMATILLDGQRAAPTRLTELGFTFRFPTAEAALRDLLK